MGYLYLVTHLRRNPSEQGLTLLSRQDTILSLWYYYYALDNFFIISKISQKVTKKGKKSLISPGKIKNEKDRNENETTIILALLIGHEAVLSL